MHLPARALYAPTGPGALPRLYASRSCQIRDLETISAELCLKDIDLMAGAKEKAYSEARKAQGIARTATPKGFDAFEAVYDKVR